MDKVFYVHVLHVNINLLDCSSIGMNWRRNKFLSYIDFFDR